MAILVWTHPALQDLQAICEFIAEDNPTAANKVGMQIFEKSEHLKTFPNMGQIWEEREEVSIRALHYGSYRILYEVTADETTVNILGVFHTAMHPDNYKL